MTTILLFGIFALALAFNIPIAISLGISSLAAVIYAGLPLDTLPINIFSASSKFSLLAIPFFIVAGNIMEKAGISEMLIEFARALVGHRRNGISMVCVIVSCFFAAISGSGPATVAALGIIMIPAMVQAGYPISYATALMAAGGAIGVIIPPSVTFIVFGSISGASIGRLFSAGVIPGILMGVSMVIVSIWMMRKQDIKHTEKATGAQRWAAFKKAFWGLMMPVIILGGIYAGIFTPTEAAAVSAVYGLAVGIFIYKRLKMKEMVDLFSRSAAQTGVVLYVMICASIFAWVLTVDGIADDIGAWLTIICHGNLYLFLFITNLILLFAGCVMDAVSAIYILTPILLPVALKLGYDITAFGVLMCVNLAIGLITPPVGVNLFTGCGIARITIKDLLGDIVPLIIGLLVVLAVVTYFPQVYMFLPNMIMGGAQ